tara:strand:+ start:380 stop:541 length:162 start_codon:yes stop_codon:yes gene_type:complete
MQQSKVKEIVRYIKYGHDTWLLPHWEDFDGDMDDEIESLEDGYEDWIKHTREE